MGQTSVVLVVVVMSFSAACAAPLIEERSAAGARWSKQWPKGPFKLHQSCGGGSGKTTSGNGSGSGSASELAASSNMSTSSSSDMVAELERWCRVDVSVHTHTAKR